MMELCPCRKARMGRIPACPYWSCQPKTQPSTTSEFCAEKHDCSPRRGSLSLFRCLHERLRTGLLSCVPDSPAAGPLDLNTFLVQVAWVTLLTWCIACHSTVCSFVLCFYDINTAAHEEGKQTKAISLPARQIFIRMVRSSSGMS